MASAFKCDLCGGLYEAYDGVQYEDFSQYYCKVMLGNRSFTRPFDTYPKCMEATINFMKSRKEMSNTHHGE